MALYRLFAYAKDFEPIYDGRKTFGVIGLDRLKPAVGDTLIIEEVWPGANPKDKPRSTGRAVRREITYLQYEGMGVAKNFVVAGLAKPATRTRTRTR